MPPGWYPDSQMAGTQRYWDGARWTEQVAPMPVGSKPARKPVIGVLAVAGGILLAFAIMWAGYALVTADNDLDCATKNADRALDGRRALDCD